MTATIIAVASAKGGSGKTMLTAALCQAIASEGKRVVAVDLDPEHGISEDLGTTRGKTTIFEVLNPLPGSPEQFLPAALIPSPLCDAFGGAYVWGIPGSHKLSELPVGAIVLKQALAPIMAQADYILLDCQPYRPALEGPLRIADRIVVPTMLDRDSVRVAAQTLWLARGIPMSLPDGRHGSVLSKVAGMVATNVVLGRLAGEERDAFAANHRLGVWVHRNPFAGPDNPDDSVFYRSREWIAARSHPGYRVADLQLARARTLLHDILTATPDLERLDVVIDTWVGKSAMPRAIPAG
jgi:cellulose biosynthesis protein BcsQ